ncbi:hypothetical protein, partial [Mesorhizobium sp. M1136]|uniref:hypothetical protein n=1 Tax=Mesorhizobium sp. M1136 TaxID=2957059 RepID=UPI00333A036E
PPAGSANPPPPPPGGVQGPQAATHFGLETTENHKTNGSSFHGNAEPLDLFWTQFRTENRFTLFLELLKPQ